MELNYKLKIEAKPEIIYSALVTDYGIKSWFSKEASVGKGEGDTHYLVFQKEGNMRAFNFRIIKLVSNEKVTWSCLYSDNPIWPGSVVSFDIGNDGVLELLIRDSKMILQGQNYLKHSKESGNIF